LYFANASGIRDTYTEFISEVRATGCENLGIMLPGDDPEYLLWVLAGKPNSEIRIEWIVSGPTARYEDPSFIPCSVICNGCPDDWTDVRGLEVYREADELTLYANP
jgi:hypothetical protein